MINKEEQNVLSERAEEIRALQTRRVNLMELLTHYDRMTQIYQDDSSYDLFREMAKLGKELEEIEQKLSTIEQKDA